MISRRQSQNHTVNDDRKVIVDCLKELDEFVNSWKSKLVMLKEENKNKNDSLKIKEINTAAKIYYLNICGKLGACSTNLYFIVVKKKKLRKKCIPQTLHQAHNINFAGRIKISSTQPVTQFYYSSNSHYFSVNSGIGTGPGCL